MQNNNTPTPTNQPVNLISEETLAYMRAEIAKAFIRYTVEYFEILIEAKANSRFAN